MHLPACFLVGVFLTAAGPLPAAQEGRPTVPKAPTLKAQVAQARALERALRGLKGAARREAQLRAAAAYEAVYRHYPEAAAQAGRALYRAAELYERARDREQAHRCLDQLLALKAEPRTLAQGRLLLGHLYRRARNLEAALKAYRSVVATGAEAPTQVAQALEWIGKCLARRGDHQGARKAWEERIRRFASRPRIVIESYDWIACDLFREGRTEEAKQWLARCEEAMAAVRARPGRAGEAVRRALREMRIRRLLERAARKAPGTGSP